MSKDECLNEFWSHIAALYADLSPEDKAYAASLSNPCANIAA